MIRRTAILTVAAGMALLFPSVSGAAGQERTQVQSQLQQQGQEQIYGSQLMTQEELAAHRAKMRSLKTNEERAAYRLEHHNKMQERAKEKGITLPDEPPLDGSGMGPGGGMGMGLGGGRNR